MGFFRALHCMQIYHYETEGQRFESSRAHHIYQSLSLLPLFFKKRRVTLM